MTKRIRVLMVDDEERFRTITAKILDQKGYDTIMAASGEECLDKLSENPDVVILDVRMGGMDGHETLKLVKEQKPELPVIMLTGHGGEDSAKDALESGVFDYLAKPCDIDLLAAKIDDAFAATHMDALTEKTAGEVMIPLESYTLVKEDDTLRDCIRKLKGSYEKMVTSGRIMETGHRSVLVTSASGAADANVFFGKGIAAGVIGTGMTDVHTLKESIALKDMVNCAELTLEILQLHATGKAAK